MFLRLPQFPKGEGHAYKQVQQVKLLNEPSSITPEQQYWKSLRPQHIVPSLTSYLAVTPISFRPPSSNLLLLFMIMRGLIFQVNQILGI